MKDRGEYYVGAVKWQVRNVARVFIKPYRWVAYPFQLMSDGKRLIIQVVTVVVLNAVNIGIGRLPKDMPGFLFLHYFQLLCILTMLFVISLMFYCSSRPLTKEHDAYSQLLRAGIPSGLHKRMRLWSIDISLSEFASPPMPKKRDDYRRIVATRDRIHRLSKRENEMRVAVLVMLGVSDETIMEHGSQQPFELWRKGVKPVFLGDALDNDIDPELFDSLRPLSVV